MTRREREREKISASERDRKRTNELSSLDSQRDASSSASHANGQRPDEDARERMKTDEKGGTSMPSGNKTKPAAIQDEERGQIIVGEGRLVPPGVDGSGAYTNHAKGKVREQYNTEAAWSLSSASLYHLLYSSTAVRLRVCSHAQFLIIEGGWQEGPTLCSFLPPS